MIQVFAKKVEFWTKKGPNAAIGCLHNLIIKILRNCSLSKSVLTNMSFSKFHGKVGLISLTLYYITKT